MARRAVTLPRVDDRRDRAEEVPPLTVMGARAWSTPGNPATWRMEYRPNYGGTVGWGRRLHVCDVTAADEASAILALQREYVGVVTELRLYAAYPMKGNENGDATFGRPSLGRAGAR